jgi:hypothetical protein
VAYWQRSTGVRSENLQAVIAHSEKAIPLFTSLASRDTLIKLHIKSLCAYKELIEIESQAAADSATVSDLRLRTEPQLARFACTPGRLPEWCRRDRTSH